jgi:PAS domain S-box-containing protein
MIGLGVDGLKIQNIDFFRARLFRLLLFCLIPTGLMALVPGVFMAIKAGTTASYLVAGVDTLIACLVLFVILSKNISIHFKKTFIIGSIYFLAVFLLISLGSFGPGIIYILLLTVLMALLFSKKTAQLSIWMNLIICVGLGLIIEFKLFNSMLIVEYKLADWVAYSSNIMLFTVVAYLLITTLIINLEGRIKELSISETRQLGLLASQTNYVIRTDLDGKYTYANNKFINDFGWLEADDIIIGREAMASILPHHHQLAIDTVVKCLASPSEVFQVSLDKPRESGGVRTTLWEFTCINGDNETSTEIQCVGIDISDRIRVEKELELSLEDLYKHNRELQTYAYVISHTLRAPIANIIGLVNLVEMDKEDPAALCEYIRDLKESASILDQVVRDLSKSISLTSSVIELPQEEVNLLDIFSMIQSDLGILIRTTNTSIEVPKEDFVLRSHKPYLYVIFHNLIYNSIKYKSDNVPAKVVVSITANTQYVIVAVTDNGTGINLDKQYDDLFKPYKRFNTAIPGKGLGLFYAKRHIEALGGIILVESELGVGSSFKVVLPKQIPATLSSSSN